MAATLTVSDKFKVNSLHSYFLLPATDSVPIIYNVRRVRDGKSFCTRSVTAKQNGQNVFVCETSFHIPESSDLEHEVQAPNYGSPEEAFSAKELLERLRGKVELSKSLIDILENERDSPKELDVKYCGLGTADLTGPSKRDSESAIWFRAKGKIANTSATNSCVGAFATDFFLLTTALKPIGVVLYGDPRLSFIASLDHCVWFHREYKADEWHLHHMSSSIARSGRAFCTGRVFNQKGELVMSISQEGAIRLRSSKL